MLTSWTYTYDNAGNIQAKNEYAYTTGTLGAVLDTVSYTYGDSSWKDLLTGYDGTAITSDTIGNMLSDGTWTYTGKHGRQLASMTNGSTTWSYTYNADGMRTRKTNGTTTYNYLYRGTQLSHLDIGTTQLYFAYDTDGTPFSLNVNGVTYYYLTNLQGDVIAIVDSGCNVVVNYVYDAWGNILHTSGSMASTLGVQNPLRYRGYVYDEETGLYYLQSRYYNPEMGRFINADAYTSTSQGILGNNMFAYCLDNPVNYIARNGTNAEALQWWTAGMGWLPFADTALPIGDIIYVGGILLLGAIALASDQDYAPEISYDEADVAYGPPSPNNDDDDDDDDYYDDDSNFGGRSRISKGKGNTPGDNQRQNRDFNRAANELNLNKNQRDLLHHKISNWGLSYHEIIEFAKAIFNIL